MIKKHLSIILVITLLALSPSFIAATQTSLAQENSIEVTDETEKNIVANWYKMVLELVRHTATYTPPVASRAFAYLGITLHEAVANTDTTGSSTALAKQLNGLRFLPKYFKDNTYDRATILEAAMSTNIKNFFSNTGPSGQGALNAMQTRLEKQLASRNIPKDVLVRSTRYGTELANAIYKWSLTDGGAEINNMGFPQSFIKPNDPAAWIPTSSIAVQQAPLLPNWGNNRTFALKQNDACRIPAPPGYSTDANSEFYKQANEVFTISQSITPEQRAIARFWSDDPMLSPTPPGHWVSIVTEIFANKDYPLATIAKTYASLGMATSDAFVGCWHAKFQYNLLRPVTYIRRVMQQAKWESMLTTPPFPEYPSGHSVQSAAAATVLTKIFGKDFAFTDSTHAADGLAPRQYKNFWQAANEAAISRLYGGIHFRAAIEQGLVQGNCIGEKVNKLKF